MKKTFALATLAAAIATPAFAQSSVNLYGRLNVTLESTKWDGQERDNAVNNNASRIGFRGVEDLGGGLKAGFRLEHGFDPGTGTQSSSSFWNRESELYLQGNWGTVRLGKWTPETYLATADYISMHNHDTGLSADALYVDTFPSNRVGYRTPTMGSFQGELAVAEGKIYHLSGTMGVGSSFELGAGYSEQDGADKQVTLRANGTFGNFTLGGYYQHAQDWGFMGDRDSFRLAGMYVAGNNEFHVNVGGADDWSGVAGTKATQYTLGVNHNLSKRTKVYGYYTALEYDAGADMGSFALGVRHNF